MTHVRNSVGRDQPLKQEDRYMTVYPYLIVADSLGSLKEVLGIERKTRKTRKTKAVKKTGKTKAVKKTKKGRKA